MLKIPPGITKEIQTRYLESTDSDVVKEYTIQQVAEAVGEAVFINAIFQGRFIKKCRYCGQLFVAHGAKECYCNRLIDGKNSCKKIGPAATRYKDPIKNVMDNARKLHLWRRAASGKTREACDKYAAWCAFASKTEQSCRSGDISLEDLKKTVGKEYEEDKVSRKE